MSQKTPLGILISGRGSNMQALVAACSQNDYPAQVALVLANRADAAGLAWAKAQGIATAAVVTEDYPNREAFDAAMTRVLEAQGVEFICLAGFMRILSAEFVTHWQQRMINIHPSLLPKFKGLDTHRRALEAGEAEHGCSVHWVTPGLDEGPVIAQARVPVLPDDTAETLAARVLVEEHQLYPAALRQVLSGAHA